jgi:hypothetical protein
MPKPMEFFCGTTCHAHLERWWYPGDFYAIIAAEQRQAKRSHLPLSELAKELQVDVQHWPIWYCYQMRHYHVLSAQHLHWQLTTQRPRKRQRDSFRKELGRLLMSLAYQDYTELHRICIEEQGGERLLAQRARELAAYLERGRQFRAKHAYSPIGQSTLPIHHIINPDRLVCNEVKAQLYNTPLGLAALQAHAAWKRELRASSSSSSSSSSARMRSQPTPPNVIRLDPQTGQPYVLSKVKSKVLE